MSITESEEQVTEKRLLSLIKEGVTPYHVVQEGIRRLKAAGFTEWPLNASEPLEPGRAYYTNVYGTTLIAFRTARKEAKGFRIATAHTDSPVFHVKPNASRYTPLYEKLNVEAYGGAIWNTWMDRPLLLAGRVCVKGNDCFSPKEILYCSKRPVAVIPNLAIHMNREVNKGVQLKVQTDMEALLTCCPKDGTKPRSLQDLLAEELGVGEEDILDYDLALTNAEEGCRIGYRGELLQAPRLDNLTSCDSCLSGLIASDGKDDLISLIALFDNEECGSNTKQGAGSAMLSALLEKILICSRQGNKMKEIERMEFLNSISNSFVVSLDVAHASHPNHPEKSDPTNMVRLDGGVIIKMNSNQRYATDTSAVAAVEGICRKYGIAHQKFVNHGDIAGGGTLGSILSSSIPAKTVDVGVPLLGMHSSRELMALSSQIEMNRFVEALFQE